MKKVYEQPIIEVEKFENEDVITTSSLGEDILDNPNAVTWPWEN